MGIYYGNEFYGLLIKLDDTIIYRECFNENRANEYKENVSEILHNLNDEVEYDFFVLTTCTSTYDDEVSNTYISLQPLVCYPKKFKESLGDIKIDIIKEVPDSLRKVFFS